MSGNLTNAKRAKNDEFYTQYNDIEKEITAYIECDPNVFRDKTILLPCDDPERSNFTLYFAQNFELFGLKKLIGTCYSPVKNGKIFTLTQDISGDGKIDFNDLEWGYLSGDGDFRSEEVSKLRDEADIIITNPPFSLFREFLAWVIEADKKFVIIGNKNCVTYKDVFPLIKENKMWSGRTGWSSMWFETKNLGDIGKVINGINMKSIPAVWFTNLDHGRRHQPLPLRTMEDNLKFSKHKKFQGKDSYDHYENYNAIEVPYTDTIPSDYTGVMGVPISFLDKYCLEQFDILGTSDNGLVDEKYKKTPGLTKEFVEDYYKAGGKGAYREGNPTAGYYVNNVAKMAYKRILIKHRR